MIGASKILTVSYGTFSCTLEGFDEPFNTMKAIAEYFRDLAAEDRYFGAEPPTPDAAMLHRIAEREIQRRVEAKIQDNGVILRAGDTEAPALSAPAVAAAAEVAVPSVSVPSVTAAAQPDANGESVAARLSRLRHAQTAQPVAEPAIHHVAEAAALADDAYTEDQHSDDILANIAALAAPEPAGAEVQYTAATDNLIAAEVISDLAEPSEPSEPEIEPQDLSDLVALDTPADSHTAQDGYDEDLAVQDAAAPDLAAAFADDFPAAESLIAAEAAVIDDTAAEAQDLSAAEEYDDEILADLLPEHEPAAETDDFGDAEMLASLGALIAENDQIQPKTDAAAEPHIAEVYVASEADTAEEDALEDDILLANLPTPAEAAPAHDVQPEPQDQPAPPATAPEAAAQPGEKIQRARARVIKIRRADAPRAAEPASQTSLLSAEAEAALQAELAALEAEAPPAAAPVRPTRPVRSLAPRAAAPAEPSFADDAHLAAALAEPSATEQPAAVDTAAADAVAALLADSADTQPQPSHHAEGRKLLETESDDDAVARLIAATNSAMDDEDSRRRHSAISHLKAAVAATEAERQIKAANPGRPQPDRQDIYRHDLESVVRPKPADNSAEARAAANAERLTPLVLVSEQRIDRAKASVAPATTPVIAPLVAPAVVAPAAAAPTATPRVVMPVRPRRVSGAAGMAAMQAMPDEDSLIGDADDLDEDEIFSDDEDSNFFAEGQNFADFAEKLGAQSLAELLEASGVYCAQVLGRPNFSRPLVMRQLETLIDQPDHQREDRLRAFGSLLRQGRIAKVKRGQFAMTERSPLLAEALRFTA